jgi:hypothetical protein
MRVVFDEEEDRVPDAVEQGKGHGMDPGVKPQDDEIAGELR